MGPVTYAEMELKIILRNAVVEEQVVPTYCEPAVNITSHWQEAATHSIDYKAPSLLFSSRVFPFSFKFRFSFFFTPPLSASVTFRKRDTHFFQPTEVCRNESSPGRQLFSFAVKISKSRALVRFHYVGFIISITASMWCLKTQEGDWIVWAKKGSCWLLYLHALFIFRTIAHNMSKTRVPPFCDRFLMMLKIKHKSFRFDEIKRSPHITSFS